LRLSIPPHGGEPSNTVLPETLAHVVVQMHRHAETLSRTGGDVHVRLDLQQTQAFGLRGTPGIIVPWVARPGSTTH
jgi:hypothetical protein